MHQTGIHAHQTGIHAHRTGTYVHQIGFLVHRVGTPVPRTGTPVHMNDTIPVCTTSKKGVLRLLTCEVCLCKLDMADESASCRVASVILPSPTLVTEPACSLLPMAWGLSLWGTDIEGVERLGGWEKLSV